MGTYPYVFEATVQCERSEKKGVGQVTYTLTLNRSATLAHLQGASFSDYLSIKGCGLDLTVSAPAGNYTVNLSVITPHIQLTSDGKSPSLAAYEDVIADVVQKAARQAHRAVAKPETATTIKAAAWQVMPKAYFEASSGQTLPANARQIMYAARGEILQITGKKSLDDHYFTQALLPDYIQAHPKETADWDVVFDDRGSFTEPHTGRVVPLGTVEVRKYIGERPTSEKPASVSVGLMFPTVGPLNRYRDILFIEKERFSALIAQVGLAERFDIAVMSTKGMSVTAARLLIDKLMQSGVRTCIHAARLRLLWLQHLRHSRDEQPALPLPERSACHRYRPETHGHPDHGPGMGALQSGRRLDEARGNAGGPRRDPRGDQTAAHRARGTQRNVLWRVRAVHRTQAYRLRCAKDGTQGRPRAPAARTSGHPRHAAQSVVRCSPTSN